MQDLARWDCFRTSVVFRVLDNYNIDKVRHAQPYGGLDFHVAMRLLAGMEVVNKERLGL